MKLSQRRINNLLDISMALLSNTEISGQSRHISFILRRNKILGIGVNNSRKTHPIALKMGHRFASIHSELNAILNTPNINEIKGLSLINIRLSTLSFKNKKPVLRMAKPCESCAKLIIGTPAISNVYYSTNCDFEKFI